MKDNNTPEVETEVRDLDGILPEGFDRRQFLSSAVATVVGGLLAGCTGSSGSGGNGSGGNGSGGNGSGGNGSGEQLIFQTPWKATPNYAPSYAAQYQGFWDEAGASTIVAKAGQGSGDTAKRIGTGTQAIGHSNALTQLSGLAQGYNLQIIGAPKASSMYGVVYRKDYMNSGEDLANKKVYANSASTQQMWDIYTSAADAPDSTTLSFAEESTSLSLFSDGSIKAVYTTLNDAPAFLTQAPEGLKVGINPVGRYIPMYGYLMSVNGEWLSRSNNMELATAVLEGYSHAGKWTLLNPGKALKIMTEEVNPGLQTASKKDLRGQMKTGVAASNLNDPIKNNGFGYLHEKSLSNTFEEIGSRIEGNIPPMDDVVSFKPRDNADLATFSNDEWNQVQEFADPFGDIFNKQISFNADNF